MPRPKHYRAFGEVDKLVRLIRAMTCVENGIKWEQVDKEAIWQGYDLAFPGARSPSVILNEVKDLNTQSGCTQILPPDGPQDDKNVVWDEYWDWSPKAYGK